MKILVVNCGSSSMKYKLFNMEDDSVPAQGLVERIGMPGSRFTYRFGDREIIAAKSIPGHQEALEAVIDALTHRDYGVIDSLTEIQAVGHRVVHGGENFRGPVVITDAVLEELEGCSGLAPLHNPPSVTGIHLCRRLIRHGLQVAVFDTAFHQTMPDYAYMYALPYEYYEKHQVRKYGFHGTSHKYVSRRAAELLGSDGDSLKMITCHLGNGASLCAVDRGRSRDTTMGLTPLAGVMMGTRCGDIDPAIIDFLADKEGLPLSVVTEILNKKSGVLGVSGLSNDFRDLERAAGQGHQRAGLALNMFVYSVAKAIGSLIVSLGGLDALVFTAGVGENSPSLRARICRYLKFMNISIDAQRNAERGKEMLISADDSAVSVLVIPTDEERMIARETSLLVGGHPDHRIIIKNNLTNKLC